MRDVLIVDSGGSNLASLKFAFRRLGANAYVSDDPRAVAGAERVVLPGVGSAMPSMRRLRASGLADLLPALTQPVLGVCLGMQLLFERSDEGPTTCLGLLPHTVRALNPRTGIRVPHTGWNTLGQVKPDPLLEGIAEGDFVYYVHSYSAPVTPFTLASAEHGVSFSAVVRRDNFWGTQFHPERSAAIGSRVLRNFLRL